MAFFEIIERALYQSDANAAVALKLRERAIERAVVFDLCGIDDRIEPADQRIAWVRWPIEDGPIGDAEMLHALASFGARAIDDGTAVVAMCEMGRNRSGLLAALVAARVHAISGVEAMRLVRAHNPEAIANEWFEEFLMALA